MMGAGLYSLLGLAGQYAGNQIAVAFLLGAIAAAFSNYSYARLGAAYPGSGGPANFTVAGFGPGWLSGSLNVFQYLAYLVAAALYAAAFAEYVNALFNETLPIWAMRLCGVSVVFVFSLVSLLGARTVGRAASVAMGLTILALIVFAAAGISQVEPNRFTLPTADHWNAIAVAAGILYVNYQGFGVVTNASGAMQNPQRELPRAMFAALGIVTFLYVIVSVVTVGIWPINTIEQNAGHVLASIAKNVWGTPGLIVIGISAMLATAAAVNATIFAAAHIACDTAKQGTLPKHLAHIRKGIPNALLFSAVLVALMVVALPLVVVGQMASQAFLLVYALVTVGHWRIADKTGARRHILMAAIIINLALFAMLFRSALHNAPVSAYALIALLVGSGLVAALAQRDRHHQR
jgi:amino acid transporter